MTLEEGVLLCLPNQRDAQPSQRVVLVWPPCHAGSVPLWLESGSSAWVGLGYSSQEELEVTSRPAKLDLEKTHMRSIRILRSKSAHSISWLQGETWQRSVATSIHQMICSRLSALLPRRLPSILQLLLVSLRRWLFTQHFCLSLNLTFLSQITLKISQYTLVLGVWVGCKARISH